MLFENLANKFTEIFKKLKSHGRLTETDIKIAMRELKLVLIEADVNFSVVKKFIQKISERAVGEEVLKSLTPGQQIIKIVRDELSKLLGLEQKEFAIKFSSKQKTVVMMCGLQGVGKTTQSAKLAKFYAKKGHRPLLVACDIYRPAAIEQLKIVGEQAGVDCFELGKTNPCEVAKKSLKHAEDFGYDLIILDTAGRLQIDEKLMQELEEIKSEVKPAEVLLVVDSMAGQDAVNVALEFEKKIGISGVILTKLDGDTRAGAALSILQVTGKPIKFVGVGEKVDDFEQFQPDRMASRILNMGDVLTLIEKAEENFKKEDVKKIVKKMDKKKLDLTDVLEQMEMIKKFGSIGSIVGLIPGLAGKIKDEDLKSGENMIKKMKAIINSMTFNERTNPEIINFQRKKRIATGSGTNVSDVNGLLTKFDQMNKTMKQFGKLKNKKNLQKNLFSKFGLI